MNLKKAGKLLGVTATAPTVSQVRAAYVKALYETHPDAGGSGADFQAIKEARDVLMRHAEMLDALAECPACGGSGRVKGARGVKIACFTCNGTGVVRKKEKK